MAGKPKTIELDVNGVRYEIDDDDPSGRDVRAAAGLNPASSFVLIHVRDRGSTSVGLDDKLDLKAGKVEIFRAFESDRIFTFTLDERAFEWGADSISETELREHGDVSEDKDIVLDGDHDEVVVRGAPIQLDGGGSEQLVTRKAPPRQVEIRVNGRKKVVPAGDITFEAVVQLAFPNGPGGPDVAYTVSYRHGPPNKPEGSLVAGQAVKVREGMVFNVSATNRS